MSDLSFLQIQAVQLRQLLADAGDDPILVPQLQERLADSEQQLRAAEQAAGTLFQADIATLPRVALFLKGGGVQGSEGIRPSLAGEALIQYEKMFTEQALHDEREAARTAGRHRRRRGAAAPSLFFTGTPRGSFGLEFVPQKADDPTMLEVHAQALKNVANALVKVGSSESSVDELVSGIPPRVLQPMKKFLKVLAQNGAEVRLAFSGAKSQSLSLESVQRAVDRLERELTEEETTVHGLFRGLTRETVVFDLVSDELGLITGTVADDLTEDDLERIDVLTNQRCTARLQATTVRRVSGSTSVSYLLLDAKGEA